MKRALLLLAGLAVAGCASRPPLGNELVVVLPGPDGKAGSVAVRQDGREAVLDKPYAAARSVSGGAPEPVAIDKVHVDRAFAGALAALPGRPATFLVYFLEGRDELTPPSQAELQNVLAEIRRRPEPDVVITGHADAVGSDGYNDKLSLARAERMRELIAALGIPASRIQVAGRGKREPVVRTDTPEARNRRVEISVR